VESVVSERALALPLDDVFTFNDVLEAFVTSTVSHRFRF